MATAFPAQKARSHDPPRIAARPRHLVTSASAIGCSQATAPDDAAEGTHDALSGLEVLWADAKKLDLTDLTTIGAKFATKELNDKLTVGDVGSLTVGAPVLYAPADIAARDNTVKSLDDVVTGLGAQFGVKPGERVLLRVANSIDFAAAYFSIHAAGAVAVPTDPDTSGTRLRAILDDCQPTIFVSDVAPTTAGLAYLPAAAFLECAAAPGLPLPLPRPTDAADIRCIQGP